MTKFPLSTSLPMSRLLAPSQSISRLQRCNPLQGTWYWQEGEEGWTCAISCKCHEGEGDRFTPSRRWITPLGRRKKGGMLARRWGMFPRGKGGKRLEALPSATWTVDGRLSWKVRNELMGLLWVKRIILGVPSVPPFLFFCQNLGIENSGVGVGEIRYFFSI